jgi:isopentenyl-diphosphate delta-isomerase
MIRKDSMQNWTQEDRKRDHIDLAIRSQTTRSSVDDRFFYEPLFSPHPTNNQTDLSLQFLGKTLGAPLWISSMTGGVGEARIINQNLAKLCREFGLGMGLGSCRVLLNAKKAKNYFEDFNLRPIIGSELPLYANLGIAQIEELLAENNQQQINDLVASLDADGLIVHINPLQEWFQPEGDYLKKPALETLNKLCSVKNFKLLVKEVGQGMGPKSLRALLDLPIEGIELAAFGGTNFSKLEQLRGGDAFKKCDSGMTALSYVGHTAPEMVQFLNELALENPKNKNKHIIISGGVENILDGFYLQKKCLFTSVIGQAKNFLAHAENYEELKKFAIGQIRGLQMAHAFLQVKDQEQKK